MRFDMKTPCVDCPFIEGSSTNTTLREGRLEGIVQDIMHGASFICHKTLELNSTEQQHCAGAMLYLEREEQPNQIMRIAERLGRYDHSKLQPHDGLIEPIY